MKSTGNGFNLGPKESQGLLAQGEIRSARDIASDEDITSAAAGGGDLTGVRMWDAAPSLIEHLSSHRSLLGGRLVLELGAGTALPGLLLAKLGHQVTLSDSLLLPHTLNNCREAAKCNNLQDEVEVGNWM